MTCQNDHFHQAFLSFPKRYNIRPIYIMFTILINQSFGWNINTREQGSETNTVTILSNRGHRAKLETNMAPKKISLFLDHIGEKWQPGLQILKNAKGFHTPTQKIKGFHTPPKNLLRVFFIPFSKSSRGMSHQCEKSPDKLCRNLWFCCFDVSDSLCFFGFDIVTNVEDLDKNGFKFAINTCRTLRKFSRKGCCFRFPIAAFHWPRQIVWRTLA